MTAAKPHVLIIGGGLGGLALGQALRRQNVSCEVFERDASDDTRFQGWAISLHPWFIKELLESAPDDMPDLEPVATSYELGIPSEGAIFDAYDMTERHRFGADESTRFIRADRAKMRAWLLTRLNVHWGKRFTRYEEDDEGVTAFFEDGTAYRGDILVGADGVHSSVRNQLLPDPEMRPKLVPHGIIVGELTATEEQYKRWMKVASGFFIGFAATGRFFVGMKRINPDEKSARYYWFYNWPDESASDEHHWTTNASQAELRDFMVNKQLTDVHPTFAEVIRATPEEGMLHPPLRLRDMTPPTIPRGRISLLGDAVHPMAPFRGEGGNMAMKDGFTLAVCLGAGSEKPVQDRLKDYESEMTERTTKSVLASRNAG